MPLAVYSPSLNVRVVPFVMLSTEDNVIVLSRRFITVTVPDMPVPVTI